MKNRVSHPGQVAGSARKRKNRLLRQEALAKEAAGLRITVDALIFRKAQETQRTIDDQARLKQERAREADLADQRYRRR